MFFRLLFFCLFFLSSFFLFLFLPLPFYSHFSHYDHSTIHHPNIITFLGTYYSEEFGHCIVTEYLEGKLKCKKKKWKCKWKWKWLWMKKGLIHILVWEAIRKCQNNENRRAFSLQSDELVVPSQNIGTFFRKRTFPRTK